MNGKKIIAIIQARTGSTRLPNKVLLDLERKPVLLRVVDRVLKSKKINAVIVATTTDKNDQKIVDLMKNYNPKVFVFQGSEKDLLDRYYWAARHHKADIVVRITSDCPLIDSQIIDKVVNVFLKDGNLEYVANVLGQRTYPRGLDVEVFSFTLLKKLWQETKDREDREHVTLYLRKNPHLFKCKNILNKKDYSYYRWTIDEEDDYNFIKIIYQKLYPKNPNFKMKDVIELLRREPELIKINQDVRQKNPQF